MSDDHKLTPVRQSHLTMTWRVPMLIEDGIYILRLAQNYSRMYSESELPETVKAQIAMIHAFPFNDYEDWEDLSTIGYINNQDQRLNDVGWRLKPNVYMLILSEETMESL